MRERLVVQVVAEQPFFVEALQGMKDAGVDPQVYMNTKVEPTDRSFVDAAEV